jgi:hypothetical protein
MGGTGCGGSRAVITEQDLLQQIINAEETWGNTLRDSTCDTGYFLGYLHALIDSYEEVFNNDRAALQRLYDALHKRSESRGEGARS